MNEDDTALSSLQRLLWDLFQLDLTELDFGIYRLFRIKKAEVETFLDEQLPAAVDEAFEAVAETEREKLQSRVEDLATRIREDVAEDALRADGSVAKEYRHAGAKVVRDLIEAYESARARLEAVRATEAQKAEVFNHLYAFFRRYYEEGDFIPKRRYGAREEYAVPYNGEEVLLHWANRDQYYVKNAEVFRDYAFTVKGDLLSEPCRVRFVLSDANLPPGDTKGDTRYFFPRPDEVTWDEDAKVLLIPFEYRLPTEKETKRFGPRNIQDGIVEEYLDALKERVPEGGLHAALFSKLEDDSEEDAEEATDPPPPPLIRHLRRFVRRNTSDYFVHRDLEGFLDRELEFYIKDQLLHLADLDGDLPARQRMLRVFRFTAGQVIDFLAQIEEVQKRLFEKRKFVIDTQYCVTLDQVPEDLYDDILANEEQLDAWRKLYAIDQWDQSLFNQGAKIDRAFLEAQPYLMVDTAHFAEGFKARLVDSFDDIDGAVDGLLVHGENFQALNLLRDRFRGTAQCVYIDPPFNTESNSILYKNNYKHSSWLSMMQDRLRRSDALAQEDAVYVIAIDEHEQERLGQMLESLYPGRQKTCVTIIHNPGGTQGGNFKRSNEYAYFIYPDESGIIGQKEREDPEEWDVRPLRDVSKGDHLREDAKNCFYPIFVRDGEVVGFGEVCDEDFHPPSANVEREDGTIEIFPIDASGNERKWTFARNTVEGIKDELTVEYNSSRDIYDIIRTKKKFNPKTTWTHKKYNSNTHGSKLLNNIVGSNDFDFPKSVYNVMDCISLATRDEPNSLVVDYFAGSGTTGHAIISMNRDSEVGESRREYVLAEMGKHFDTVLRPRLIKVVFSSKWKDGVPQTRDGISHMIKYIRIESYEDALHNLVTEETLERAEARAEAVKRAQGEETYRLQYLAGLPLEASGTMLNVEKLAHPFRYEIEVLTDEGPAKRTVDLVETFTLLYGLRVRRIERWVNEEDGGRVYKAVSGTDPDGQDTLVLWRDMKGLDPAVERAFLEERITEAEGAPFDVVLINGDSTVPEVRSLDPIFKARME